jgi:hypothetical protein
VADALSRNPLGMEGSSKMAGVLPKSVNSHSLTCKSMLPATPPIKTSEVNVAIINGKFKFDYTGDQEFGKIWQHFSDSDSLVNRNVRIGGLICVPKKDRQFLLKACHESEGHPGGNKLADSVMEKFYWHRVCKDSKHFAEAYPECQANKSDHNKPQGFLHPLPALKRSWKHVTMDFFFDLPTAEGGYNGVLLVVDRFSKLVKLIPLTKDISASKVAQLYLKYVYCNYGLPVSIVSDQDTHFDSEFWLALWRLVGTSVHMGAARHQQTDGQSERTVKTINQTLKMYLNKAGTNWLQWLPLAEFWYNSAKHSSIGKSPFEVVQGRNPRNPIDSAIEAELDNENPMAAAIIKEMLSAKGPGKK